VDEHAVQLLLIIRPSPWKAHAEPNQVLLLMTKECMLGNLSWIGLDNVFAILYNVFRNE